MIRVALRGLAGRKLRAMLTALAIVLGVAMVSGTYVLTDTIQKAFDAIFTESYRGTSAVISGRTVFDQSPESGGGFGAPTIPQSLLDEVRKVPNVDAALGGVADETTLIDKEGEPIVSGGAPNLGFSIDPSQPRFNTLQLVDGQWPSGDGEVAIDRATAEEHDFAVGDTIGVAARGPAHEFRITGLVVFGAVSSIGGATLAAFDLPTAQKLFEKQGRLDQIRVAARAGVSPDQLVRDIKPVLPRTAQVRSGETQAQTEASGTSEFIGFLQNFLLAFGGIALFVGSFVIANTLSITIAQRTRELATIRTVGGSRVQVLSSIVLEALVVGVLASVAGLFLGLALAKGLNSLFVSFGIELPSVGLVFKTRTIVVSLAVGILITLAASLRPALRATRVAPILAVREGATLPESRFARFRALGAAMLAAVGIALLLVGLFVDGLSTPQLLAAMGAGAVLVFFAAALFAGRIAAPMASAASPIAKWTLFVLAVLFYPVALGIWLGKFGLYAGERGWTQRTLALAGSALLLLVFLPVLAPVGIVLWVLRRFGKEPREWPVPVPGVLPDHSMGRLARENAARNPTRTASTAAALMIGLALVTLVAVLGAGIRSTFQRSVDELFVADYAITAQNNFSPLPVNVQEAAARVDGVDAAAGIRGGEARIGEETEFVTAVDRDIAAVIDIEWTAGDESVPSRLGADGAFLDEGFADERELGLGDEITLLTPTGRTLRLEVKGIFDPPTGGSPFGAVTFSSAVYDRAYGQPRNQYTFLTMRGGVTDANTQALASALAQPFPNAKVQTREEFKDNQISGLNQILNILYVLLALSVIVSLFGIVNTLVLSVFERTRELGMLRAIGMTRLQTRRMIRYESVVTALIGAALGILLGIALAALLVGRIEFIEFALPLTSLVIFTIAAIVVGVLAAIFPARRASRLRILEALQYE